jgi:hypothetical protein
MQDTMSSKPKARVITIRVRGRLTALFGVLLLVALLPFLAASAPRHASVLLAAGAPQPAAIPDTRVDAGALGGGGPATAARNGAPLVPTNDLFLFPTFELPGSVIANASQTSAAAGSGLAGFIWPVHGPESSGFGPRIHPVLGRAMFHTGIDLVAACGTPIHAAADGQVVYAAITPSWGRRVIIQHTPGLETGYAHMSRFLVTSGETVKQGDVIGLVGTTGWSTGCHLHFDVIVDGQYVDPAPYLGLPPSTTARIPYYAAPHLVLDDNGTVVHTVEDGDVPIPPDTHTPATSTSTAPRAPEPTTSRPNPTTSSPTTSAPTGTTTTEPTTSPTGTPAPSGSSTTSPTGTPTPTPSTTTTGTTTTGTPTTGTPTTGTPTSSGSSTTSPTGTPTTSAPTTSASPSAAPTTTTPTDRPTTADPTTCPTGTATANEPTTGTPGDITTGTCPAAQSTEPQQPGVAATGSQPGTD